MTVEYTSAPEGGRILLCGELDHHAAMPALHRAVELLDEHQPGVAVLDLERLTFMDSSGIALLMGLERRMRLAGGRLTVQRVPAQAWKVLHSAGMDRRIHMTKKEEQP